MITVYKYLQREHIFSKGLFSLAEKSLTWSNSRKLKLDKFHFLTVRIINHWKNVPGVVVHAEH